MHQRKKSLIIDGLKINYYFQKSDSQKPMLVFLHGWASRALHLRSVWEKYSNFVALDLPGFGLSDQPKGAWDTGKYAIFLNKFIQKLELENYILIGHSFGGAIVIKHNSLFDFRGKSILIASAGIREGKINRFQKYKKVFEAYHWLFSFFPFKLLNKKIGRLFYERVVKNQDYLEAGKMREIYLKIIQDDLKIDLIKNQGETFLIWGKDDQETPLEEGQKMKSLLKNSQLFILEGAGHFVFLDKKEEFLLIFQKCINDF